MGLMLQVIWQLRILCAIALILTVTPESSGLELSSIIPPIEAQTPSFVLEPGLLPNGTVVQPPVGPPSTKSPPPFLPPSELAAPRESPHDSGPPLPQHDSTPPLVAETPSQQPHVSASPLAAESSHDSAPPSAAEPARVSTLPSVAEPPRTAAPRAPVLDPESPKASIPPPTPPEAPPVLPSAPSTFIPHESPAPAQGVPPHASTQTFIVPSHASFPPPFLAIQPSATEPPYPSALPLAAKPPESVSPPRVAMPAKALTPSPEEQPISPLQPPVLPASSPHASATPIPPQLVPSPALPPNFVVPSHELSPPPFEMLPPQEPPPPMLASPPTSAPPPNASAMQSPAVPPYVSANPVPPVPPNASFPPPQRVPSRAPPPNYVIPSHDLSPPPVSMSPPQEPPPPILASPPHASAVQTPPAPPYVSTNPVPPVPLNAPFPPPQQVPSRAPPPNFVNPSQEPPPPFLASPPHAAEPPHASAVESPPVPPHESSPLPEPVPPYPSPTTTVLPPPFASPPPELSASPPTKLPHASPPPSSTMPKTIPPRASSPPPLMKTYFAPPPHVMPFPPSVPPPAMAPPRAMYAPPPSVESHSSAPTSPTLQGNASVVPPQASQRRETQKGAPPPLPGGAPPIQGIRRSQPPVSHKIEAPRHNASFLRSNASAPNSTPISSGVPPVTTPSRAPGSSPKIAPPEPKLEGQNVTAPAPATSQVPPPSNIGSHNSPRHSPFKGFAPFPAPSIHNSTRPSSFAPAPIVLSPGPAASEGSHSSASSPSPSIHKHPYQTGKEGSPVPSSVLVSPPAPSQQGQAPLYAPISLPAGGQKHHLPSAPGIPEESPAPSPLSRAPAGASKIPFLSPKISPSGSSTRKTKRPLASPILALPPPPPNQDCAYLTCPEPLTNAPPGSPCDCVWPMQVGLRLSVALYTFFPLVTELAGEVAAGAFMRQSQVRVMGASAATEQPEKTIVLVNLVPLNKKFDNTTALLTFQRFWHKQVAIDKSIFGDYDVLYVRYPGLPASPPLAPADIAVINGMPYSVGDPNGSQMHPLGVDVTKQSHKRRLNGSVIAAIAFSATVVLLICCALAWFLIVRHTNHNSETAQTPRALSSLARSSAPTGHSAGSGPSSSLSFGSSLAPYAGSAKTFSASEIEKATDNFNPARVVGEGGFGRVYSGVLEDDTRVAVKVLKRDDQQGGREFLAEVEMLSRLHHRNLVKLIGICVDERMRCLVYELIPNGSVESHLHGTDKENAPLDWVSRMKIALGAARGLAYLHEDSSPRVIHRDFKSSNILLENDFTPKVSDFGLARTAMDEENRHISTRVMGTFGYVAPEYAMTGHLLVKSDVYSYGVVLLELLTGRKPVDMLQPPGQENLVAWARPLLTTKEGLESMIDPSLGSDVPFESVAKVAAIASMCVQPEVSHRPFMGEVVQALKLVCNECDDSKDGDSTSHSRENLSMDFDSKVDKDIQDPLQTQLTLHDYLPRNHDIEKGLSVSEVFGMTASLGRQTSSSFRRYSASGPMRTAKGPRFWQRVRRLSQGSVSEHGIMHRIWAGSH